MKRTLTVCSLGPLLSELLYPPEDFSALNLKMVLCFLRKALVFTCSTRIHSEHAHPEHAQPERARAARVIHVLVFRKEIQIK